VRFGEAAWGVQFHPEMDAAVTRQYVAARREFIDAEGLDAEALLASADDARAGASTLTAFLRAVGRAPVTPPR
jgi:GMP synthase-like glutamine amidotransferase